MQHQPGLERAVAEHELEVLGEQERRAEQRELVSVIVADAAVKRGLRKKRMSSIGAGRVTLPPDERAEEPEPPQRTPPSTSGDVQPWSGRLDDREEQGRDQGDDRQHRADGSSGLSLRALESGTNKPASEQATAHIGTLIRKTEPQPKCSTSRPPTSGPIAMPTPATPAQMPMARARSPGRGTCW